MRHEPFPTVEAIGPSLSFQRRSANELLAGSPD